MQSADAELPAGEVELAGQDAQFAFPSCTDPYVFAGHEQVALPALDMVPLGHS